MNNDKRQEIIDMMVTQFADGQRAADSSFYRVAEGISKGAGLLLEESPQALWDDALIQYNKGKS